ncbi:hypothetical protein [Paraburkholderia fungorum]|uniref:hypothetical protein n=1 Tax=Paraburkholderia fungorum TaxID=134537 RepID=UPI0020923082|nr:hypothetical protein [Paraburkholderia fungorum]USU18538.1 hypothetical protein NFE55_22340 [Paraburkholderia fungorum]USU26399.1 hypothetical protein NFS19_22625 [Paraburkholderia fungorum]
MSRPGHIGKAVAGVGATLVLDTISDAPFLLAKLPTGNMSSVSAGSGIRSSASCKSGHTSISG